jgi:hypothetical protein
MNFKSFVAPVAALTLLIGGVVSTQQAKADSWSSQRIGNTTFHNGYDADGGSYMGTTQRIGGSTFHNGTDSYGNSYKTTCTTIGNSTFCN